MIERIIGNTIERLFHSSGSWIEGDALQQLSNAAQKADIQIAVGLPDLHPGKGAPVGAAFLTGKTVYPFFLGNDVGCGVGLWSTSLKRAKIKTAKIEKKLKGMELPWAGNIAEQLSGAGLEPTGFDAVLGTIGGGNHFAELQVVEEVFNPEVFEGSGLDKANLCLVIHSGSRGLGEVLLRRHTDVYGAEGLTEASDTADRYIGGHDHAVRWAAVNRQVIGQRFSDMLGMHAEPVLDICHNMVEKVESGGRPCWLHRKGAAPSDRGLIVIPGSRGTLSYLVEPIGRQDLNLWSLAHGAGRKWSRKTCKQRLLNQTTVDALRRTALGGIVICEDRELLFEEAPQAYKNITTVINDMVVDNLIRVIATLRPVVTYKTRKLS